MRRKKEGQPICIVRSVSRINNKGEMSGEVCEIAGRLVPKAHALVVCGAASSLAICRQLNDAVAVRVSSLVRYVIIILRTETGIVEG